MVFCVSIESLVQLAQRSVAHGFPDKNMLGNDCACDQIHPASEWRHPHVTLSADLHRGILASARLQESLAIIVIASTKRAALKLYALKLCVMQVHELREREASLRRQKPLNCCREWNRDLSIAEIHPLGVTGFCEVSHAAAFRFVGFPLSPLVRRKPSDSLRCREDSARAPIPP